MLSSARQPHAEMGSLADSDDEPDTLTAYGDISLTADYEAPAPSLAKPSLRPKRRRPPAPSKLRKAQRYDSEAIRVCAVLAYKSRAGSDVPHQHSFPRQSCRKPAQNPMPSSRTPMISML